MRKRRTKQVIAWLSALAILMGNAQGVTAADPEAETQTTVVEEGQFPKSEVEDGAESPLPEEDTEVLEQSQELQDVERTQEQNVLEEEQSQIQAAEESAEKTGPLETAEKDAAISGPVTEITMDDLNANEYETYYHCSDMGYTYQGEAVNFISETQIQAGEAIYNLKNKEVTVKTEMKEDGAVSITLEGIKTPIGSVSGKWNSTWGGNVQMVYQTNIPEMKEIRSEEGSSLKNTITLAEVPEGTWTLSGGTIYEKANSFSPGIDFGDGRGTVQEGTFGVLPDITFTVTAAETEPEEKKGRLSALEITGGTLSPEFAADTIYYTLTVPEGTETISVNPTAETEDTIVLIRDNNSDLYSPGSPVPVADGDKLRISASLDIATSYFITVKVEKKVQDTERLKDLQVTGGTLEPAFSEENSYYTLYVTEDTESISLQPVKYTDKTEVRITYDKQTCQPGEQIPVKNGEMIRVTGTIKTSTGVTASKSYLLTFKVMKSTEYGFTFSDNGSSLKMVWDKNHEDGTPYLKVMVPKGTEMLTMERSKRTEVKEQGESGATIILGGIGDASLLTASYIGKENYFVAETEGEKYYVYLEEIDEAGDDSLPRMDITEEDLNANAYETFYYSDKINYYYQDSYVVFTDTEHFKAGTEVYELKNQKTTVTVEVNESGAQVINLSNLAVPVGSIPGEWSSDFGGTVQVVYQTDIPGMEEIRSENLMKAITLNQIPDGTYHLTKGTIYEKANEWSSGHDFGDGKGIVKEGYFGTLPDIILEVDNPIETPNEYIGVPTKARVYDDFENDIWLPYQQKELKVGETTDLYPWRVPQIVADTINNDVQRPTFHFKVIQGDSISLDTESSTQKVVVKAKKAGTSIVKVTYDAVDYQGQHWGAISPVNTAYAVFTVGEKGKAVIQTNDEFRNWRHYDTIYYNEGETVPYAFTVEAENAKSVKVTVNGIKIEGDGNQYTANLENRSNVIGIVATDKEGKTTSMYRIIDARFIEVNVENKTHAESELKAGDTANISFRGITMPVYKLATIYNPQFGRDVTRVLYENEMLGAFEGKCGQWDLATNNDFDVTFAEAGSYTFISPLGIRCTWWGEELGSDLVKQGQGDPNLSAVDRSDYFSVLPNFIITVTEAGDENPNPNPDPEPDTDEQDQKMAAAVMEKIDGLGVITLLKEPMVVQARKAYEALTDTQKALVTNLDVLEGAEAKIKQLKEEAKNPNLPEEPGKEESDGNPDGGSDSRVPGGSSGGSGSRVPGGSSGGGGLVLTKSTAKAGSTATNSAEDNEIKLNVKNHKVSKADIKKIVGQDKNLVMTDKMEDGTIYTMTLHGKDVKEAADMNTKVTKKSAYEEEIQLLAPNPEIFVFEQDGTYPGEVLVEIETDKQDGTYLLFYYDTKEQKAVYVQKITVKDSKTKFVIEQGGEYFIDEKAKTKSVSELKKAENVEAEVMAVSDATDEAGGLDGKSLLLGVLIGVGAVALLGGGYLLGRRKQKRG